MDTKISAKDLMEEAQRLRMLLGVIGQAVETTASQLHYPQPTAIWKAAQSSCGLSPYRAYSHAADQVTAIRERKRDLLEGIEPYSRRWYDTQATPEYEAFVQVAEVAQQMLNKWGMFGHK